MTSASSALPTSMLAIDIRQPGGPEELVASSHPLPALSPGHLLVRIAAAGVNRPDVFQRMGAYPPPKGASPIPGLEFAGEVVAAGEGVYGIDPAITFVRWSPAVAMRSIASCMSTTLCQCPRG